MEELAKVIAKAIKIIGWLALAFISIGVTVGASAGAYHLYWNWQEGKILVEASLSEECDDPDFPLQVLITNNSSHSMLEYRLSFGVFEMGRSSDMAKMFNQSKSDYIINSGKNAKACFPLPEFEYRYENNRAAIQELANRGNRRLSKISFTAEIKSVVFE